MTHVSDSIKAFFEDFDRANNAFDPQLLGPHLSDPFVGADPHGNVVVLKKDDFLAGIKERQEYLHTLGFRFVKVVPLEETPLGDRYLMVKTHGIMRLEEIPGQPVDLVHDSAYILFIDDGAPRIVFALGHEDPQKMLQEQGVSPIEP